MKRPLPFVWPLLLFCCGVAVADDDSQGKPYVAAQRSLAINRSLLTRTESEYAALLKEEYASPSDDLTQRLGRLRYKISALKEDAVRLRSAMPKNARADEFVKDVLVRQEVTGQTQPLVDDEREKRLMLNLQQVFLLHEKALAFVADDRYEAASKTYEEILLLNPDDDEAYLLLGHSRLFLEDYEKARTAFLNAVHIDPVNAREITRLYENVVVENPQDDATYAKLGFVYWILGDRQRSREAFVSALQVNPENAEARGALGSMAANAQ